MVIIIIIVVLIAWGVYKHFESKKYAAMNREDFSQFEILPGPGFDQGLVEKEVFFSKMQPYFDQGLVREVYSSDKLAILSLGERIYVACPYIIISDVPFGIFMNPVVMKKLVLNNAIIYPLLKRLRDNIEEDRTLFYFFPEDKTDKLKKWIDETSHINQMDPALEKELKEIKKQGVACMANDHGKGATNPPKGQQLPPAGSGNKSR